MVSWQLMSHIMNESNMIVGIAWYRPEQYGLLRALSTDTDSMEKTYEEWLAGVTRTMDELRRIGVAAQRVDVEIKELVAWCQQRGLALDGQARSQYAAEFLRSDNTGRC